VISGGEFPAAKRYKHAVYHTVPNQSFITLGPCDITVFLAFSATGCMASVAASQDPKKEPGLGELLQLWSVAGLGHMV
jgi:hypothetical protein